MSEKNSRGIERPKNGIGQGRRLGRNTSSCPKGGPGYGNGNRRGNGINRKTK